MQVFEFIRKIIAFIIQGWFGIAAFIFIIGVIYLFFDTIIKEGSLFVKSLKKVKPNTPKNEFENSPIIETEYKSISNIYTIEDQILRGSRNPDHFYLCAKHYISIDLPERAIQFYTLAINKFPMYPVFYYLRSECYASLNNSELQKKDLEQTIILVEDLLGTSLRIYETGTILKIDLIRLWNIALQKRSPLNRKPRAYFERV